MKNILAIPPAARSQHAEIFDKLLSGEGAFCLERIVSCGHQSPPGHWYDQGQDEWVLVLEGAARVGYEDGREISLQKGDSLFIPRHVRHRVAYTSAPCVWLAVHGSLRAEY